MVCTLSYMYDSKQSESSRLFSGCVFTCIVYIHTLYYYYDVSLERIFVEYNTVHSTFGFVHPLFSFAHVLLSHPQKN